VCPRLCWQHRFKATVNRLAVPTHVVIVAGVVAPERVDAVPGEVLAEFGMAGVVPVRLPGGQGTRWRAGPVVLNPADSVRAGRWFAEVYDGLNSPVSASRGQCGRRAETGWPWGGRPGGGRWCSR